MANRYIRCTLLITTFLIAMTSSAKAKNMIQTLAKNLPGDPQGNNIIMNADDDSFAKAIQEMDRVLQKKTEPCHTFDPQKPFLKVEGRRKSEIQCFEHIWEVKLKEETKRRVGECQAKYGQQFTGIVGGRNSRPGEYPHMGAIGWKGEEEGKWEFKCGSFLVSERFALTAAHCQYDDKKKHPKIVRFGAINISNEKIDPNQPPQDIKILEFIKHPSYRPNFRNFDIAAIKLANRVTFNDFVQPACIMNQIVNQATITGWGYTDERIEKISDHLQVAEVNVLPNTECSKKWKPKRDKRTWPRFFKSQMCATKMDGVGDICAGDSGGPLQTKLQVNTNMSILNVVGITAHNYNCGSHKFPSVYTRVSSYIPWIEKVVWDDKNEPAKLVIEDELSKMKNDSNKAVDDNVVTEKVTYEEKLYKENPILINEVHNYANGFLFLFDTKKESNWAYIDKSELARYNNINEITGNELK